MFSLMYNIKPPPKRLRARLKTLQPPIANWFIGKVLSNFDCEIRKISNAFTLLSKVSSLCLIELIFKWPIKVFLAHMIVCCWISERLLSIVDREGNPLKEEELLTLRRLCVLSCQAVSNISRKSLKFLTNLDIPASLRCCFPLLNCVSWHWCYHLRSGQYHCFHRIPLTEIKLFLF